MEGFLAGRVVHVDDHRRTVTVPRDGSATPFYENITLVGGVPQVTFGSTCVAGLSRQILMLKVTSPDGRVSPTMSFMKGDD